jgi:hypothetical protein
MSTPERQQPGNPLQHIQTAAGNLTRDVGHAWEQATRNLQHGVEGLGRTLSHVAQLPLQAMQRHGSGMHAQPLLPGMASLSLNGPHRAQGSKSTSPAQPPAGAQPPQPVFDVAYNPEDIKARLSGVPVYAVINKKEEFVLIAGDADDNQHRNMGLFFFNKQDAQSLIDKVREGNPKLGKESRVMQVGMDAVYQFATSPRSETGTEGVIFRFMPDASQVNAAVKLYQEAGVAAEGFTGVPVFQAEGLTVKTGKARYTPLFLSKADLDIALANADGQRQAAEQAANTAKATRAQQELEAARLELDAASGEQQKAVQVRVDAAAARVEKYMRRVAEEAAGGGSGGGGGNDGGKVGGDGRPRVEVGCLEEVLVRMEHDDKGEWGEVMFVPAGSLTQPEAAAAIAQDSGKKKKRK